MQALTRTTGLLARAVPLLANETDEEDVADQDDSAIYLDDGTDLLGVSIGAFFVVSFGNERKHHHIQDEEDPTDQVYLSLSNEIDQDTNNCKDEI
jgi:hypothetical protein